uniref:Uncharacterized protein n=1 Tax=Plectus sambesii TaxID=2011161 RepID=A0A914UPQ0_9BILA
MGLILGAAAPGHGDRPIRGQRPPGSSKMAAPKYRRKSSGRKEWLAAGKGESAGRVSLLLLVLIDPLVSRQEVAEELEEALGVILGKQWTERRP